ncbi:hypothetical protein DITRI_Ditri09bG0075200 [Diplodiscus trichospermus]
MVNRSRVDKRANLHTVFVDRLSKRVSKKALWDLIDLYGDVMDIYIPYRLHHSNRRTAFAFVRKFGKEKITNGTFKPRTTMTLDFNGSDHRTYKEVALGHFYGDAGLEDKNNRLEDPGRLDNEQIDDDEELKSFVEFNHTIADSELDWLKKSVIVTVKELVTLDDIMTGGVSAMLKFDSFVELSNFMEKAHCFANQWFIDFKQWDKSFKRLIPIWISLEEVPLHLWNVEFVKALGETWGTFVKVDYETGSGNNLNAARVMVLVESKMKIPSIVRVKHGDSTSKITVYLEDDLEVTESPGEDHGKEGKEKEAEKDIKNADRGNFEFSQTLSLLELAGWGGDSNEEVVSSSSCDSSFIKGTIEVTGFPAIKRHGGVTEEVCQVGAKLPHEVVGNSNGVGFSESQDCNEHGANEDNLILGLGVVSVVPRSSIEASVDGGNLKDKRKKKMGEIYAKATISKPVARGRRKPRKELVNAIKECLDLGITHSDFSISDDDIQHRNLVLRKEVEDTWEVSSVLGLVFDREKEQMIELFHDLEKGCKKKGK